MSAILSSRLVIVGSRLFLGALFIYYSWSKITDLPAFATAIKNYDMLPLALIPAFAKLLAGVELVVGIALVVGIWKKGACTLVCGMLFMFIMAIGTAYLQGKSIDCGCNLADISPTAAAEKRAHMLQRFFEDVGYFILALNLLYQVLNQRMMCHCPETKEA